MARYFKDAEGDYDLEDLEYRGQEYDFIKESSKNMNLI